MDEARFIEQALGVRPEQTLEALTGNVYWRQLLKGLIPVKDLDDIFHLGGRSCICLTGAPGAGKRTLALAFAGSAVQSGGMLFRLTEEMLADVPEEEIPACINLLFRTASDPHQFSDAHKVLMFEPRGRKKYWNALAAAYARLSGAAWVTVLIVEEDQKMAEASGIPDLLTCLVTLPGKTDREAFFASNKNVLPRKGRTAAEKEPSHAWMAEKTDGLNYSELNQIIRLIRLSLKKAASERFGTGFGIDRGALIAALKAGEFCIDEDMFLVALGKVKEAHENLHKPEQTETPANALIPEGIAGLRAGGMNLDALFGVGQSLGMGGTPGGITGEDTSRTDEQRAMDDVMGLIIEPRI